MFRSFFIGSLAELLILFQFSIDELGEAINTRGANFLAVQEEGWGGDFLFGLVELFFVGVDDVVGLAADDIFLKLAYIEVELFGIALKDGGSVSLLGPFALVLVQQREHIPEFSLVGGSFGGPGGSVCILVNLVQG